VADAPANRVEEQRAEPRFLCNRMARVHRPKAGKGQVEYALVHDLSTAGVGLHTERGFPQGTVLTIEALYASDAKPLLARVVRSTGRDDRWFHGCVLAAGLDAGDLGQWLAGSSLHTDRPVTSGGTPAAAANSPVMAAN
jgi:PilZ domain